MKNNEKGGKSPPSLRPCGSPLPLSAGARPRNAPKHGGCYAARGAAGNDRKIRG